MAALAGAAESSSTISFMPPSRDTGLDTPRALSAIALGEAARLAAASAPGQRAVVDYQARTQRLALDDPAAFGAILDQSFGGKLDEMSRAALIDAARAGELPAPVEIRFVGDDVLGGALGAYSAANGGTIYLNESLRNDSAALRAVFAQEMGHHLDVVLGGPDMAGDEGRVFAAGLEKGGVLSADELASASAVNDAGVIMVDGKPVDVEFAVPAILIWLGQGAVQTVPDAVIGAILQQLTGIPYTWVDKLIDFGLNLIPGVGQLDTAKKLAKIGEAIDSIIDAARLAERLPRGVVGQADAMANNVRRVWAQFQEQILAGDFNRAGTTWGSLIGHIREMQVAGKIADNGGTLESLGQTFRIAGGNREFDIIFSQGGQRIFAEVKTGGATQLNRGSDRFQRTLDNFIAQRDFAVSQGATYRLYADDFSADMLAALRATGIDAVQSATILR